MNYLPAILFLFGLGLLILARRMRDSSGLPGGRIVYMDRGSLSPLEAALYDPTLCLSGRPDYIMMVRGRVVPVEAKSSPTPPSPYPSHILQLGAYCRLVHHNFKKRPTKGILLYSDQAYEVEYSRNLEKRLINVVKEMQSASSKAPARSHHQPERCHNCGYLQFCDVSLT